MQTSFVDFMNHGIVPFVGRDAEIDRIVRFWTGTDDAHGLRALLLSGEAGIGKSRLVEEVLGRIVAGGGAVIHVRLYPDSAVALAPLLARCIWDSGAGRHLLAREPEGTLPAVIAALRRICRLRPTMVAMEDLHLLSGEPLAEFASLLEALTPEALALLGAARPTDDRVRGLLEIFLVDEVRLEGLHGADITAMWQALFAAEPSAEVASILHDATRGNGLALRSAVRGALSAGAISGEAGQGAGRLLVPAATFRGAVERHVRFLAEGLAAHLTPAELAAAERLAVLGEIIARETAAAVIDSDALLDALAFKGIIAGAPIARSPLLGHQSNAPLLAFTHTLLHRQLAEARRLTAKSILHLVLDERPLHSVLPVAILAAGAESITVEPALVAHAIARLVAAASRLDATPDWQLGVEILNAAAALFEAHRTRWQPLEASELEAGIGACRLGFLSREAGGPEHGALIARVLELTEDPASVSLAESRLRALVSMLWQSMRIGRKDLAAEVPAYEAVIERYPVLHTTRASIDYLAVLAKLAPTGPYREIGALAERRMDAVIAAADADTAAYARERIGANLLWMFDTPEELERRLEFLRRLDPASNEENLDALVWGVLVYDKIGELDTACAWAAQAAERFRLRGQAHVERTCRMVPLWAEAARGGDLDDIERRVEALIADAPAPAAARLRRNAGARLTEIALYRNDGSSARRVMHAMLDGRPAWYAQEVVAQLCEGDLASALATIGRSEDADDELKQVAQLLVDSGGVPPDTIPNLWALLSAPVLQLPTMLVLRIGLELAAAAAEDARFGLDRTALDEGMRPPLRLMMSWLAERGMCGYLRPLVEKYAECFAPAERRGWRERLAEIERRYVDGRAAPAEGTEARLGISMLGVIAVTADRSEPVRLRGDRLRTFLGLLVADRMLAEPLSHREFCRLASGGEMDPEKARKGMNLAVHRLRDVIGRDAILTDEPVPRLNLDVVHVDLVAAHRHALEARALLRDGRLARAQSALIAAFDVARGDVPFPGLYDPFFEAAREDFESLLRSVLLELAHRLLREEDAADAAELLRRGLAVLDGDGEIAELLVDTLVANGNRTAAERVRISDTE